MMNSYDFKIQATTICCPSSLNSKNKNFLKLDSGAPKNNQGCLYSPVLKKKPLNLNVNDTFIHG